MIRRFPAILRLVLFGASLTLLLTVLHTDCPSPVQLAAFLFLAGSGLFYCASRRCPYCLRFGLDSRPFSKDSGYCSHCGRLVEYKKGADAHDQQNDIDHQHRS